MGFREIGRYPDKIWLHRCNSMEKLYEKHMIYPNIEVDLVFRESRKFDVTHDADTTFYLGLASYFSYMRKKEGKMWLDIKNLTPENRIMAFSSLDRLVESFQIEKDRLIIEGQSWKALEVFTQSGYYTSFYVPYDDPDDLSKKELKCFIKGLQEIADKKVVSALSFPGCWYTEIKESLNRSIDLLTWEHRSSQLQLLLSSIGREMLFDPQLKVILVKDKGKYHR
ncbi:hypothetical protein DWW10_25310 [Bacteroides intestinalis]|uniref:Uncharacterized protein n=2 Tax=Bacteroides intestinalis TaxID=329854 RepID=A0A412XPT7_9BACE|nr:hypothetical protein DWW10_25310 [Bacteroides intestinalis]RHA61987.1 hypothetical protein DW932_06465 [Bacteroides intestinalis]